MYSKGIRSQSKLTPCKPQHRNLIVSHDLCSLSRLYWVLQIPSLPLKAIKFLALLGATKALTMKTCMLRPRWVCSLADWNNGTARGVNSPHLTHLGALVREGPTLELFPNYVFVQHPNSQLPLWLAEHLQSPLSAWKEKSLSSPAHTQETLQVQLVWTILITQQDGVPFLHYSVSRNGNKTWVLLCYALYKQTLGDGACSMEFTTCTGSAVPNGRQWQEAQVQKWATGISHN